MALTAIETKVAEAKTSPDKHRQMVRRVELLERLVSNDDLLKATRSDLTAADIEEMFGITSYDRQVLMAWYGIDPFKTGYSRTPEPEVRITRTSIDPGEIAERVVALAADKLDAVIEVRVKLAVARALHDVANRIGGDE